MLSEVRARTVLGMIEMSVNCWIKTFHGILDLNMDLGTRECVSGLKFRVVVTRRLNPGFRFAIHIDTPTTLPSQILVHGYSHRSKTEDRKLLLDTFQTLN